jgi:hypothetical protein
MPVRFRFSAGRVTGHRSAFQSGRVEWVAAFDLVLTILLMLSANRSAVAVSVGLYITAAYWFTASTSFANPAVTIAQGVIHHVRQLPPARYPDGGSHLRALRLSPPSVCTGAIRETTSCPVWHRRAESVRLLVGLPCEGRFGSRTGVRSTC